MTKPLTIEIADDAAEQLMRIANDLGQSPEEFAAQALAASIRSFEANVSMTSRAKGLDRKAALAWLKDLATRGDLAPDADDILPPGYSPNR